MMFDKLINRLNKKKQQLQDLKVSNESVEDKPYFDITISKENNFFKMLISDYISISDYVERMKLIDKYNLISLICNAVLWNVDKQKVNKGVFYVISIDNRLYNIFNDDDYFEIDERIDKGDITEERLIRFNIGNNNYKYTSLKHYGKNGSTFYVRYYYNNDNFSFGKLDLSKEDALSEISSIISNLENIDGIENIFDIDLLKKQVLDDLDKDSFETKKYYK